MGLDCLPEDEDGDDVDHLDCLPEDGDDGADNEDEMMLLTIYS